MMKQKRYVSLLFIPLFLASCGNVGNETKLPNNGTAIDTTVGKEKLKAAVKSEITPNKSKSDAFGFTINGAHISENLDGSIMMAGQSFATLASKIEAKNGKFNFGVKGMTSSSANDFRATLSAGIDINGASSVTYNPNLSIPVSVDNTDTVSPLTNVEFNGNYKASADIFENNLYIDLSNKHVFSFISTYFGQLTSSLPANGKMMIPLNLEDKDFPLLDASNVADFDADYEEFFKQLPQGGEFKDHGKAGFSYSGKLGKDAIEKEIEDDKTTDETLNGASVAINADSYFGYTLLFKETGFVSYGIDASVGFNMTADLSSQGMPSMNALKFTVSGNISFGMKFKFLRGDDVKFPTVKTKDFTETKIQ